MRLLRNLVLLALAGFGAFKAWEMLRPRVQRAQMAGEHAADDVVPAVRDAARNIASTSSDAAGEVVDVTRDAASTVGDAVTDAVHEATGAAGAPSGSDPLRS